jgi:RNA polymerase primary sigma factor
MGLEEAEVTYLLEKARTPVTIDRPVGESEEAAFGEFLEDPAARPESEESGRRDLASALATQMEALTLREREVLTLHYGLRDGHTCSREEIAERFRITPERVRQIEARAMVKLQHPNNAAVLEEFLPR